VTAFHVQWIKRCFDPAQSKWKCFFQFFISRALPAGFLLDPVALVNVDLPPFYRDVVTAWIALDGGAVPHCAGVFANRSGSPVSMPALTVKGAYQLLVRKNARPAHCVTKYPACTPV
jgi:hypothetical protein